MLMYIDYLGPGHRVYGFWSFIIVRIISMFRYVSDGNHGLRDDTQTYTIAELVVIAVLAVWSHASAGENHCRINGKAELSDA